MFACRDAGCFPSVSFGACENVLTVNGRRASFGMDFIGRAVAQLGSAPALGAGGRRFESDQPDGPEWTSGLAGVAQW